MKHCAQCGAIDNPVMDTVNLNPEGEPTVSHFVRPEIQYLKAGEQITIRQLKQGWFSRIFQGRPAIERDICMNCLNSNYIRRQLNDEYHRKALALEKDQSGESNFYLMLADVDGSY